MELGQKVFNSHISSGAVDHFTSYLLTIILYRKQKKVLFTSFFLGQYIRLTLLNQSSAPLKTSREVEKDGLMLHSFCKCVNTLI